MTAILALAVVANALRPASAVPPSGSGLTVKYFAFGSNLAASVREGRRGLRPVSSSPGLVRRARLAFNMGTGFGPEPAFASLMPASEADECHGAVYELTLADWVKLCASEGVPAAYRVIQVDVEDYGRESAEPAYTLTSGLLSSPVDMPPSERYMGLLRDGAREMGLTQAWQDKLASIRTAPSAAGTQAPSEPTPSSFESRPGATFV